MVLDSFMESYRNNVIIKSGDLNLESFFEDASPCSYETAIETFFEAQYSLEAMAAITENTLLMEAAGTIETINEGVIGSFFEAAIEKIKECAKKVKDFAVACVKKVIDFFKELYNKATPIDKAMQLYGKKGVDYSDVKTAMANGFKIPGSLKLLAENPKEAFDEIMQEFSFDSKETLNLLKAAGSNSSKTDDAVKKMVEDIKDKLTELKEKDKERFTWVGQLLSDNEEFTKKTMRAKFIVTANKDKSKDGDITPGQWDTLKDYALNGQTKQREYRSEIESTAKKAVKAINDAAKEISQEQNKLVKNAVDADKTSVAEGKARVSKFVTAKVSEGVYMANRSVMVMNKVIIPTMRKMHTTAIASYIYISSGTKSHNRKADKKAGIK